MTYSIFRIGRPEKLSRGGPRSSIVDDEIKNFVTEVLEQDTFFSLANKNEKIRRQFPEKKHSVLSHLQKLQTDLDLH